MNRRFLITGCSGGGKSTLIAHLETLGFSVVHEPGLRIIKNKGPKPWEDRLGFFEAVTALSQSDLEQSTAPTETIFFDRGIFDAMSGRSGRLGCSVTELVPDPFPYAQPVFFAPPWPEIYQQTEDRPHSFEMALDEAHRLRSDLTRLRLEVIELPKVSVAERAKLVLDAIADR